jgi:trans-AT polyketide synthase/acyltransferase/oxidoreductase domain-containing protein
MAVFLFPGQGAQQKGMGGELFERFPRYTAIADRVLGYSIQELCLADPGRKLSQTQYTQPALFTVNALSYLRTLEDGSPRPSYAAGHSLGEYNALLAAEVFDFETGLRLVKKRGELMSRAAKGGMAAVFGLSEAAILDALRQNGLTQVYIANFNTPSQLVISGAVAEVQKAQPIFEGLPGVKFVPLNVSGAFHSPLMAEAREEFARFLSQFPLRRPTLPVLSNVTARPYEDTGVAQRLADQITSSVQWTNTIRYLMGAGETEFKEIGPGQILTRLVKQIRAEAQPLVVTEPAEKRVLPAAKAPPRSQPADTPLSSPGGISPFSLGSESFKADYRIKYAYLSGAMFKGISSKELVVRMGKAGLMGFLGTGGMSPADIESNLLYIKRELSEGQSYGANLVSNPAFPEVEEEQVDLFLKHGVRNLECSAYIQLSPALVRFRLKGLERGRDGSIVRKNRLIAKISRPEVATVFLSPAPQRIVQKLLSAGQITAEQAELSQRVPVADDLTVEADSAGHTDHGVAYVLLPTMIRLRDELVRQHGYSQEIRVGAAGGIGTPEAALAAFMLGADYILTGSINQCTVEAGTSDAVKDMLQGMNVQDTDYAPAGDMFELGAKVQVLKKGVFFPARANKLYELYRNHESLEEIDEKTRAQIQDKYFKRSFDEVWAETRAYYQKRSPGELERAERSPKHKMALIFKWYFVHTSRLARRGDLANKVDFQVHCGPALGAFNQWVKGTELENWRNRHVDDLARRLMEETAVLMTRMMQRYAPARVTSRAA